MNVPEELIRLYSAKRFDAAGYVDAKSVILTAHRHLTTDERWESETPYLLDLISRCVPLTAKSRVLDFGCGIGRLSKAVIDAYGCEVVGVDISEPMRRLATDYVKSNRFTARSPEELDLLPKRVDLALAIWVLQHSLYLEHDIQKIYRALKRTGRLFVVGSRQRLIPIESPFAKWADDGLSVEELLGKPLMTGTLNPSVVTPELSGQSFWGIWSHGSRQ